MRDDADKIITTSPLRDRKRQPDHPWTKTVLDDLESHKLIFTKTVNRNSRREGCWLRVVLCTVDSVQAVNDVVWSRDVRKTEIRFGFSFF